MSVMAAAFYLWDPNVPVELRGRHHLRHQRAAVPKVDSYFSFALPRRDDACTLGYIYAVPS